MLTVGSLFSGIGGLDLGLERAGMRVLWQVENDSYARAVLARRFPKATLHADVREVGARNLAPVDLICGGFPCQDISNAGKRVGIEGERSGLWSEFARLLGELRPRYALVENVAALLGRGMERVLGDLAACGYDAEWDCIPAAAVGAPHVRDRLFVVAHASGERRGEGWSESAAAREARIGSDSSLADADGGRCQSGRCGTAERHFRFSYPLSEISEGCGAAQWIVEPDVGRVAHGIPARVDRLRCLGNAVVPQVAEYIGRCILSHARAERP